MGKNTIKGNRGRTRSGAKHSASGKKGISIGRNKSGKHLNPNPRSARVFFSGRYSDSGQLGFLKTQMKKSESPIIDYSCKKPYRFWKKPAKYGIKVSDIFVVGIGKTTYKSKSVGWETETAHRHKRPIIAVKLSKGVKVPDAIKKYGKVISWKCKGLQREINNSKKNRK